MEEKGLSVKFNLYLLLFYNKGDEKMVNPKPILGTVVGLQSTAVMARAYRLVPKKWPPKQRKNKKFIKGFVDIAVGTALIRPTATMINKL